MSASNETTKATQTSLIKGVINLARYHLWRATNLVRPYVGGRRGLILLAVLVLGAGAAFNWGWLVAIGIGPLLLTLAPCAAMCALGLCMNKMGGKSCSSGAKNSPEPTVSAKPNEKI